MDEWMDGWMDGGGVDGWMGGWMDGWMDGIMDGGWISAGLAYMAEVAHATGPALSWHNSNTC